jgi:Flp pilus assembly protein TadD
MKKPNGSLTFLASVACAAAISPPALAERTAFEMGSYLGWPGGEAVAAGNYAAAIDAASGRAARTSSTNALTAATNLCVAHTVMGEFIAAQRACNLALTLAQRSDRVSFRRFSAEEATSRALSNRGVLRAVSGDAAGAAEDFEQAAKLNGAWDAASRNLAYLQTLPAHRLALAENSAN